MTLKTITQLAAGCAFAAATQLQADHVRIDFNAVVTSLSAPFVSEPLFNVGSTISGYYIYDDTTAFSSSAFPALIDFQATLTRTGSPIFMTSSDGSVRLSNNIQFPSGSGTTSPSTEHADKVSASATSEIERDSDEGFMGGSFG